MKRLEFLGEALRRSLGIISSEREAVFTAGIGYDQPHPVCALQRSVVMTEFSDVDSSEIAAKRPRSSRRRSPPLKAGDGRSGLPAGILGSHT